MSDNEIQAQYATGLTRPASRGPSLRPESVWTG